jgi:hypothetical protein
VKRVICNTSPLIALERIDRLSVLREMYGEIVRPQAVADELEAGRDRYGLSADLQDANWIRTEPNPDEMVFHKDLGPGETAAIALAYVTDADLIILDDLQARLVAEELGLRITGTLGVLVEAQHSGFLQSLPDALNDLEEVGFHIDATLRARILAGDI